MADQLRNNYKCTVSNTPSTTGAFTISAAVTGCNAFVAGDDVATGATFSIRAYEAGVGQEFRTGCTYTHSGTSLSRGTLEGGSALDFTSAVTVEVIATAAWGNRNTSALQGLIPGGRLTLTSGTPVTTSDVTGATSIYYTPYLHNVIALWNGAEWVPTIFAETTLSIGTVTSGANYDVFGYLSGGALTLEKLVWTNDSTRATAVTLQDGRYCKSGDKTRLYLGTFRSTSTTETEDSGGGTTSQVGGKRFLWNAYNRAQRPLSVIDTTNSWSYGTSTFRQANATAGNKVEVVLGLADCVEAYVTSVVQGSNITATVAIGVNSTSTASGLRSGVSNSTYPMSAGQYVGLLAAGYNYLAWLEVADGGTITFLGDNGGTFLQSGLSAKVMT